VTGRVFFLSRLQNFVFMNFLSANYFTLWQIGPWKLFQTAEMTSSMGRLHLWPGLLLRSTCLLQRAANLCPSQLSWKRRSLEDWSLEGHGTAFDVWVCPWSCKLVALSSHSCGRYFRVSPGMWGQAGAVRSRWQILFQDNLKYWVHLACVLLTGPNSDLQSYPFHFHLHFLITGPSPGPLPWCCGKAHTAAPVTRHCDHGLQVHPLPWLLALQSYEVFTLLCPNLSTPQWWSVHCSACSPTFPRKEQSHSACKATVTSHWIGLATRTEAALAVMTAPWG
jgi:hypothetical protein